MARPKGSGRTQGSWKPGESGNPTGRPLGSRQLLAQAVFADFYAEWQRRGSKVVEDLPDTDLAKLVVSTIPREVKLDADIKLGFAEALEQFSREYARRKGQPPGGVEGGS